MDYNNFKEYTNEKNEFMRYNGIQVTVLSEDYAEVELEIGSHSLNPYGVLHGGAYYTMADCAAGVAARSKGLRYVTLNGGLNYIKSVSSGKIKAIATMLHRGNKTCVVRVEIVDNNKILLSEGIFTMFCIDKKFESANKIT